MPTYVYKFVETGETIEVTQAFTDSTLTEYAHPGDGTIRPVKKVFQPVGVTFRGSGFYKTDSRGSGGSSANGSSSATTSPAASAPGGDASSGSSSGGSESPSTVNTPATSPPSTSGSSNGSPGTAST